MFEAVLKGDSYDDDTQTDLFLYISLNINISGWLDILILFDIH